MTLYFPSCWRQVWVTSGPRQERLRSIESRPIHCHPLFALGFAFCWIFHNIGMRFHLVRHERLHPFFEGLTLCLVVAQIAF